MKECSVCLVPQDEGCFYKKRGGLHSFCKSCWGVKYNEKKRQRNKKAPSRVKPKVTKVCMVCGTEFTASRKDVKVCSRLCGYRRDNIRKRGKVLSSNE